MSPSVELPPSDSSSSAWEFGKVAKRRYQQQQQRQRQHQPVIKVVSPQELQGIVARLSRSPGDPPPPPPASFSARSSGIHQSQQPHNHAHNEHEARQESQQPQQPASAFRPIALPPQALQDLLPQGRVQGPSLNLASAARAKAGAAGCCAAFVLCYVVTFSAMSTSAACERRNCPSFYACAAGGDWFMSPKTFSPRAQQPEFFDQQWAERESIWQQQQQQQQQQLRSSTSSGGVGVGKEAAAMRAGGAVKAKAPKVRHWR